MSERGVRRFVVTAMTSPFALPVLGGSLLAAVALGIHLGESSIGQINPIYFQGPAVHPRDRGAALDESNLPPPVRPAYRDLYGWDEGDAARAAECYVVGAGARHPVYSAKVPYFGSREDLRSPSARRARRKSEGFAETPDQFKDPERAGRFATPTIRSEGGSRASRRPTRTRSGSGRKTTK